MSIFDLFGTSAQQNAANAQIQGINTGQAQATGNINAGTQALQTNYGAALQPYLQNYNQAQPGVAQLGNVLGLNGARGNATAQQAAPRKRARLPTGSLAKPGIGACWGSKVPPNHRPRWETP
jgi:hypothetical protein